MSEATRYSAMRIEDFLAWESRQEIKYEFDGFEPVAMAGGSVDHARIQRNLALAVGGRLRGTPYEFLGSDMKLLAANRARYPDGQIVCGPADGDATFTTAPVVMFEVVSAGDETRDRVVKAAEYLRIPTVQAYVLLDSQRVQVPVMTRVGDAGAVREGSAGGNLTLPAVGLDVPLAELYAGVGP